MIDIHSHILPELDDGPQSIEESLLLAKDLEKIGFKTVFATPHVYPGVFNNTREDILDSLSIFRNKLAENNIGIDVRPGAEIFIEGDIDPDNVLTINDDKKFILLELPFYDFPRYIEEVTFSLLSRGITPIISHPERNIRIQENTSLAKRLTERGVRLQVNITSFAGRYGDYVYDTANYLLDNGLAHYLATDCHGNDAGMIVKGMEKLKALIGKGRLEALLTENVKEIMLHESFVEG
jgi:protein-tyrosine phosphatase